MTQVLLSCGLSGMAYACLAGQPMTFVAPTGLTLSFIGALAAWAAKTGVPFLPMSLRRAALSLVRRGGAAASTRGYVLGRIAAVASRPRHGNIAATSRRRRGGVSAVASRRRRDGVGHSARRPARARVRYAWCGVWTSIYLAVLASFNASGLIRYCTRFTEDVFNALLAFNFVAEGASPLWRGLQPALATGRKSADALLALNAALGTSVACRAFAGAPRSPRPARTKPTARRLGDARSLVKPTARCLRETRALGAAGAFPDEISATVRGARSRRNVDRPDAGRVFSAKARALLADFGPAAVVVSASAVLSRPAARRLGGLERLKLGAPREQIFSAVDLGALRVKYRILAMVPAVFLATLFFLDQV